MIIIKLQANSISLQESSEIQQKQQISFKIKQIIIRNLISVITVIFNFITIKQMLRSEQETQQQDEDIDNQFIPKKSPSYQSITEQLQQRRSVILASNPSSRLQFDQQLNLKKELQNSSVEPKPSFQKAKLNQSQMLDDEDALEDEENEFMFNQNYQQGSTNKQNASKVNDFNNKTSQKEQLIQSHVAQKNYSFEINQNEKQEAHIQGQVQAKANNQEGIFQVQQDKSHEQELKVLKQDIQKEWSEQKQNQQLDEKQHFFAQMVMESTIKNDKIDQVESIDIPLQQLHQQMSHKADPQQYEFNNKQQINQVLEIDNQSLHEGYPFNEQNHTQLTPNRHSNIGYDLQAQKQLESANNKHPHDVQQESQKLKIQSFEQEQQLDQNIQLNSVSHLIVQNQLMVVGKQQKLNVDQFELRTENQHVNVSLPPEVDYSVKQNSSNVKCNIKQNSQNLYNAQIDGVAENKQIQKQLQQVKSSKLSSNEEKTMKKLKFDENQIQQLGKYEMNQFEKVQNNPFQPQKPFSKKDLKSSQDIKVQNQSHQFQQQNPMTSQGNSGIRIQNSDIETPFFDKRHESSCFKKEISIHSNKFVKPSKNNDQMNQSNNSVNESAKLTKQNNIYNNQFSQFPKQTVQWDQIQSDMENSMHQEQLSLNPQFYKAENEQPIIDTKIQSSGFNVPGQIKNNSEIFEKIEQNNKQIIKEQPIVINVDKKEDNLSQISGSRSLQLQKNSIINMKMNSNNSQISAKRLNSIKKQILNRQKILSIEEQDKKQSSSNSNANFASNIEPKQVGLSISQISKQSSNIKIKRKQLKKQTIFNTYRLEQEGINKPLGDNIKNTQKSDRKILLTPISETRLDQSDKSAFIKHKESHLIHKKTQKSQISQQQDQVERIRLLKEAHKKKLERQLQKVKMQLEDIRNQEKNMSQINGKESKQFDEKLSMHERHKRQSEAVLRLVKEHRKTKELQQLQFEDIDKNITNNLIELNRIKQEADERNKEKKRMEIMERMKKNEVRKMKEQKLMKVNNQYIQQFKAPEAAVPSLNKLAVTPAQEQGKLQEIMEKQRKQEKLKSMNYNGRQQKEVIAGSKLAKFRSVGKPRKEDNYEIRLN